MMRTSSVEAVHGLFAMVQRNVYVPAPPAGVNVAVGDVVELNWLAKVEGPETTVHDAVPMPGALAASVAEAVVVHSV
jgi:hypothetical protein